MTVHSDVICTLGVHSVVFGPGTDRMNTHLTGSDRIDHYVVRHRPASLILDGIDILP